MRNQPAQMIKTALNTDASANNILSVCITSVKVTVPSDAQLWGEITQSELRCMTVTMPHPLSHSNSTEALIK